MEQKFVSWTNERRNKRFGVRLSATEVSHLANLADGRTISDTIRDLIKRAIDEDENQRTQKR